jgi:hypothetical protein
MRGSLHNRGMTDEIISDSPPAWQHKEKRVTSGKCIHHIPHLLVCLSFYSVVYDKDLN